MNDCDYIEVTSRTALERAIKACSFVNDTVIVAKHQHGVTRLRFPAGEKHFPDPFHHDKHLARVAGKVRRTDAHVWR
jgi:hypothetical protein